MAGRANQAWVYDVLLGRYVDRLIDPSLDRFARRQRADPLAHLDLVQSLAFSHDGQWIASGGYRTVKLWQRVARVGPARQLPLARAYDARPASAQAAWPARTKPGRSIG